MKNSFGLIDRATVFQNYDIRDFALKVEPHTLVIRRNRPEPTTVFDTYWKFAYLRQETFFNRIEKHEPPATAADSVISTYKFTNVFRASDRVSQYLIRKVIYEGDQNTEEVFFRILLFKLFNKIETWELLQKRFGEIVWREFQLDAYNQVLDEAMASGEKIYSAAYIMPSAKSAFGQDRKHANHLRLLQKMMNDQMPFQVQQSSSMSDVFQLLIAYPGIGPFLAYQYTIDLNYSEITDFSEDDFVVPGPGALSGISKCFSNLMGWMPVDVIKYVTEIQVQEFERMGLPFRNLWGRRLHLIDCQNLFCEVDKYSRVAHPEINSGSGRTRIKQVYRPSGTDISYWFPPNWRINDRIVKT